MGACLALEGPGELCGTSTNVEVPKGLSMDNVMQDSNILTMPIQRNCKIDQTFGMIGVGGVVII
jgi:hypothetical protein